MTATTRPAWVNRYHPDGSLKSLNQWLRIQVGINDNVAAYAKGVWCSYWSGRAEQFVAASQPHLPASNAEQLEYIGDQRPNGWFYVEDGQLPNEQYHPVLSVTRSGVYTVSCLLADGKWHNDIGDSDIIAWQPVPPLL